MATRERVKSWIIIVVLGVTIAVLAVLLFKYSAHTKTMEIFDIPQAIYDTGNLVDSFHVYKQKNGQWPEPGFVHAREATFVRSFKDHRGVRVDVYDYGSGQQGWFYFNDNNIQAHPVRGSDNDAKRR